MDKVLLEQVNSQTDTSISGCKPFPKQLLFPTPADPLLVLLKLAGETCNINCHYCFEKRKPYPDSLVLSPESLANFLKMCGQRELRVLLHGGEPLVIGQRRMETLLNVLASYPGRLSIGMQTNAISLNDSWLDFFERCWPSIDIGVSLDGDEMGNAHRVDYRELPTYQSVVKALRVLERRGWRVGIIAVINKLMVGRSGDIIDHILQFPAVKTLKLNSCLDFNVVSKQYSTANQPVLSILNPDGQGRPGWATSPDEYASFVIAAIDAWIDREAYKSFLLEPFVSIARHLMGGNVSYSEFGDAKAPFIVTLYPDGRIGSSDELRMPDALLGHISDSDDLQSLLDMHTNPTLRSSLELLMDKCHSCDQRFLCRGGGLHDRLRYIGTAYDDEYCGYRKRVINHVRNIIETSYLDLLA